MLISVLQIEGEIQPSGDTDISIYLLWGPLRKKIGDFNGRFHVPFFLSV